MLLMARGVVVSALVRVALWVALVVPMSCAAKVRLVTDSFADWAKLSGAKASSRSASRNVPGVTEVRIVLCFIPSSASSGFHGLAFSLLRVESALSTHVPGLGTCLPKKRKDYAVPLGRCQCARNCGGG